MDDGDRHGNQVRRWAGLGVSSGPTWWRGGIKSLVPLRLKRAGRSKFPSTGSRDATGYRIGEFMSRKIKVRGKKVKVKGA